MKLHEEIDETIKELQRCKDAIMQSELPPDRLSNAVVIMSGHLIRLGSFIADLVYDANNAYIYRKFKYASDFNTLSKELSGATMRELDNKAQIQNKEHHEVEIEKRRTADRVKTLHEDYRLFIMTIQTKLSVIKSELFSKNPI